MNWDGDDDGYAYSEPDKKLRRNKIDGVLGGVCAGIGDYIGLDPVITRIIFALLVIFTGLPLLIYFILWVFIPSDKRAPYVREYREARRARKEAKQARKDRYDEPVSPLRTTSFGDVKSKFRSLEVRLQDLERSITSKEWQLSRQFRDLEN
jgi:phage shock protein C